MKILVACEFSGIVRDAFIARGHDAVSCDLLPSERPGPHIQGDVLAILGDGWDLMIAHPPCTHLASSGARHFPAKRADGRQQAGIDFFMAIVNAPIPKIAVENPVGIMSSVYRKPAQIIQPWQFGENASKKTCLWLKGLPLLQGTRIIPPKGWKTVKFLGDLLNSETEEALCPDCGIDWADCDCPGPTQDGIEYVEVDGVMFGRQEGGNGKPVWSNQCQSGQNKLGPSPERAAIRSRTYPGIAAAMAAQWG
jgi:hypothetical protein